MKITFEINLRSFQAILGKRTVENWGIQMYNNAVILRDGRSMAVGN